MLKFFSPEEEQKIVAAIQSAELNTSGEIRVHLEAIGHPLVGDFTYSGPVRYGLTRQFLHSAKLAFEHPRTGAALSFVAPLPDDLSSALETAREADSL